MAQGRRPKGVLMDPREAELRAVEIEAVEAAPVGDVEMEGAVPLHVIFRNVVFSPTGSADPSRPSWFAHQLLSCIRDALGLRVIGARGSVVSVTVSRDRIEEAVRAIKSAVGEFRDSFPAVLADHERELNEIVEQEKARRQGRVADQGLIDAIMNE